MATNRYWTLADGPVPPWPEPGTFVLNQGEVPTPGPGQALPTPAPPVR